MDQTNRKQILYYCQSLVGVGHLTASLQIIRELLDHSDVDLIQGGLDVGAAWAHPGFRKLRLPTILIHDQSGELYDPDGQRTLEELWIARAEKMANFLRWPYHAIVVEFFPFGRRRFKREILDLFHKVRARCGPVPIFTCVREVLVAEDIETERRIAQWVTDHIHTVFIRGDAEVIRFEETFSLADLIVDRLHYAGYLSAARPPHGTARKKQILVSQGGGNVGRELLEAAIRAAPLLPDYLFLVAAGSRTSEAQINNLKNLARSSNVQIVPFLQDFQQHLLASALSISMGGDNTMLDVISTRTPALAFPYPGNTEQDVRITKLALKGFVHALSVADFPAERLRNRIEVALKAPYPESAIAMNGAINMSEKISTILYSDASPRVES